MEAAQVSQKRFRCAVLLPLARYLLGILNGPVAILEYPFYPTCSWTTRARGVWRWSL